MNKGRTPSRFAVGTTLAVVPLAAAAFSLFSTMTAAGPTVQWKAPAEGGKMSGDIKGPPHCEVTGTSVARVMFYINGAWTNTDGNLSNGLGCWIDTTRYANGTYRLRAVAYDAAGATATAERNVVIENAAPAGPTVQWKAPAAGGKMSGDIKGPPHCEVTGTKIARVMFYINGAWTNTDGNLSNGLGCWIDTRKYPNGSYRLRAVAYDAAGRTTAVERNVVIENATTLKTISSADILGWASGNVAFSQQSGYSGQVLGTWPPASSIPESGIHGKTLSNGETLRLGKQTDPANSSRKALAFQIASSDPTTSGGKRSELSFQKNIDPNKVYWIAFRAYVRDWGSETTPGLFGTQVHSGDNSRGLSPSFNISMSGRNFRFHLNYSTSSSPSQSNKVAVRLTEYPIPFGRWADFVIKFRHNTSGNGLLQAWMDGKQIVDYRGHLGYNTPGYRDYAKFGVYKWTTFNTPRKVLLHNPTIVLDPTGSKYSAAELRAHINR
jgi:hypothetical protein